MILKEEEKETILKALRKYGTLKVEAINLLNLLNENEDCIKWLIMTKEEFEKLP